MDDDVSVDELREAVEHLSGAPARFVEAVEVDERFNGEVVWQGAVKVFDLTGHPSGATRAGVSEGEGGGVGAGAGAGAGEGEGEGGNASSNACRCCF